MEKGISMKSFFTKHILSKKTHLLISLSTILSILIGIFCCILLLSNQDPVTDLYHNFTTRALAESIPKSKKHNTISEAFPLTLDTNFSERIPAYETFYYRIKTQKNITFTINTSSASRLLSALLSDSGKKIPCKISQSKKTKIISCYPNRLKQNQLIFLKLTNNSTSSLSIHLSTKLLSMENTAAPNITIHKKSTNHSQLNINKKTSKDNFSTKPAFQPSPHTTSNPKKYYSNKNFSTITAKNLYLNPYFLIMTPNTCQKIKIKNIRQTKEKNNFNWISTNPKIATVVHGKIHALSPGFTIIYIRDKKGSVPNSSCFLRVISR